jgi:predicted glycogen debranching enzyme
MKQIGFGREVTSHLETALTREWLVTNGIGGYALSTIAGVNTRRYHGLLIAALQPPLGRTVLVSKLQATVRLGPDIFPLTTNEYLDGTVNPHGYHRLESFALDGMIPVFTWAAADALLEQRIWMVHGQNTTYVTYTLVRASCPIALEIIPLCTYRYSHGATNAREWMPEVQAVENGLRVNSRQGSVPYWLRANHGATIVPGIDRHWSFRHRVESYRGLDDREDLFAVGRIDNKLNEGDTLALALTTEHALQVDWAAAYAAEKARQTDLLSQAVMVEGEPDWIKRLVLAADQFIVDRPSKADPAGKTVIAGYPWFGDWGRDTMIALPGLTLVTGRHEIAASILRTFASYVEQGVLPNRFLDDAASPSDQAEYETADAALWFFYALSLYLQRSGDLELIKSLYPTLDDIIQWHVQGTRYVAQDESDGLLRTREADVALTWMNARDGERLITPRLGKPVEINALWHNALGAMAHFSTQLGQAKQAARWQAMAERVAASFETRFWYAQGGYLYDVVDGPEGDDATLRPNQIFAVSLPYSPLKDREKARSVVDTVARHLQSSYGLRTLSSRDPTYVPRYGGNPAARENAYHQGTVWAWLIGPFATAHFKVYGDTAKARSFLRPFADHLADRGVGTISEIFDGDPPHTPRGCIASAWSVAQVLCGWLACSNP